MNKIALTNIFTLAVGVIIGSAATMQYFKTKYENQYQEDLQSIKEVLLKEKEDFIAETDKIVKEKDVAIDELIKHNNKETAKEIINYCGYAKQSKAQTKKEAEEEEEVCNVQNHEDGPYIITPEEFRSIDDYDFQTLIYYADGHVATDTGDLITNYEDQIGYDALEHFGEYEEDTVYVRNDEEMMDFEVIRSDKNFTDILEEQRMQSIMEIEDEY